MTTIKIAAVLALFAFLISLPLTAGEISPGLMKKTAGLTPADKIPVVIALKKSSLPGELKKEVQTKFSLHADRHKFAMEKLQREAAAAQHDIWRFLKSLETKGQAANLKSYWIANIIIADLALSELAGIAARTDVAGLYELPQIDLLDGTSYSHSEREADATSVETNLRAVKADSAWARNYTGEGRLVCSLDNGVNGEHPALKNSWNGLDADSAASWFDPVGGLNYPHTYNGSSHGTHTMGIMVGHDDNLHDTIGVAPGARWISAAVTDVAGASIIDGFEWAADPDRDPNTIDDVPDVINHSWGVKNIYLHCDDYFWEMIDNTEALGIVNIFAAGNDGPNSLTIANPANRALDSLDCFAVGNYYHRQATIFPSSSRGPSDCDNISIKPNLVAPGDTIRSAFIGTGYGNITGTSMAAPHVAGAVAILRQAVPNATADEIKEALLKGATPIGPTSPNNDYGWGLLNINAAIDSLMTQSIPELRIYSFDYPFVDPGDTVRGYVAVKNFGNLLTAVFGDITGAAGGLEVLTNHLVFGAVPENDTAVSDIPLEVAVSDTVTPGTMLTINMNLQGTPGYARAVKLYIRVGELPRAGYFTHRNSKLRFTISNLGYFGLASGSFLPFGYYGFLYKDTLPEHNDLHEGALMLAIDSNHVSDAARTVVEEPDNDFAVAPGGDLIISDPGVFADQETSSALDDSRADNPIGLQISQRTFSWNNVPDDNYVLMEYIITNTALSPVSGLYCGLFFDWDIHPSYAGNCGGYEAAENLAYMHYCLVGQSHFRGIAVANPEGLTAYTMRANPTSGLDYYFSEGQKDSLLRDGINTSFSTADWTQVVGTGPYSLAPGQSDTAVFVILAGDSLAELQATAVRARDKYLVITDAPTDPSVLLPSKLELEQNHPNPFNATTTISLAIPTRGRVRLAIFNLLGQEVADLVDQELAAGRYRINWDGRNRDGQPAASGVYFYRLEAEDKSLVRKMILLK